MTAASVLHSFVDCSKSLLSANSSSRICSPHGSQSRWSSNALRAYSPITWLVVSLLGALLAFTASVAPLHAQTAYFSGGVTTPGAGFPSGAIGVAVDGNGNIYVTQQLTDTVTEIPLGCTSLDCMTSLGGGFGSQSWGLAVDGKGNIYVADSYNHAVKEMPPGCTSSACVTTLGGGFNFPMGLTLDRYGNIYVADNFNGVMEMPPGCASASCVVNLGGGWSVPSGVAVDQSGNIYVADWDLTGSVKTMPPGCASSACVTTLGGGFAEGPDDVGLDAYGNLIVASPGMYEMPPDCRSSACVSLLGGGWSTPQRVAVDTRGNIYTLDDVYLTNSGFTYFVKKIMQHGVNFDTIPVGSIGQPLTLYFTFTTGGSDITTSVLTQGVKGLDFANAGTGSCDTNGTSHVYSAGDQCTVDVIFSPKYAGARYGGAQLLNGSANVVATAYLYGWGNGPQLVFWQPSDAQTLMYAGQWPEGVAVDGSGNIYLAPDLSTDIYTAPLSTDNSPLEEIPPGCGSSSCVTMLGGGFNRPWGVALDGLGNIYIGDSGNNAVKEMPPGCNSPSCVTTLGGGFNGPEGVAVDGSGNIYVADTGSNAVKEMPQGCASANCVTVLGGGFDGLESVAVDGSGNVYVADSNNNAIKEMPQGCSSASCVTTRGSGWIAPVGVAVDGSGDLYVETMYGQMAEIPVGCDSQDCTTGVPNGPCDWEWCTGGITLDGSGNLYYTKYWMGLEKISFASVPNLNFDNSPGGSQGGPLSVMLNNIGNAPLIFTVPLTGENPSISANFALGASTTCPEATPQSSEGTLAPAANCTLTVDFDPLTSGQFAGSAVLTDNDLNVANATQDIGLSATVNAPAALTAPAAGSTLSAISATTFAWTAGSGVTDYQLWLGTTGPISSDLYSSGSTTAHNETVGPFPANGAIIFATLFSLIDGKWQTENYSFAESGTQVVNFAAASLGTTAPVQTLYFTFAADGSGTKTSVLTEGAQGLDFTNAGTGSCDTNGAAHAYSAGDECTVNVTFSPKYPGERNGSVQLLNSSGNVIATAYVYGLGQGPEIAFPGNSAAQTLGGGYSSLNSVDVDASGNAYVTDHVANAVKEVPAGCTSSSCVTTLGGGFSEPSGVALDGGGNIYIADSRNNAVKVMPPGCASADCVTALGGGFSAPASVTIDGSANVYVADSGNSAVKEMPPGCASSSCVTTLGGGFDAPSGLALDASGNVYVADSGNHAVKEVPVGCASASCVTTVGGGFSEPADLAVDASGTVYVADAGSDTVYEMPPGCASTSCVTTFGGSFSKPAGIALDGSGNVYVTDAGNNTLDLLNYSSPPSHSFASTNIGSQSSDSPLIVMLSNIGNLPLTYVVPETGDNPSVSMNFALDPSTTCPEITASSSGDRLAAGTSCTLAVDFAPTATGSIAGAVVLTDDNLNVPNATQTISLSGTTNQAVSILTSPAAGSTLSGVSATTFNWTAGTGVSAYRLYLGTTGPGTFDLYNSGSTTALTETLGPLPSNGGTLFATLFSLINGLWLPENYTFVESGTPVPASLTAPTPGSTLSNVSVTTFAWKPGTGVTAFQLWLGTAGPGSADLYNSGSTTGLTETVGPLPTNGAIVYVTLLSLIDGSWQQANYTFAEVSPVPAILIAPAAGSTLSATVDTTFTWTAGTGVTAYQLSLGTTAPGSSDLYNSGSTTALTETVGPVPANGETIFVTLSSLTGVGWKTENYDFIEPGTHIVNFGNVWFQWIQGWGPEQTIYFTFAGGGIGIAPSVLTQGVKGQDFADAGTGSCDTNGAAHVYSAGDECTVNVIFSPKYAGERNGAVQLLNGSGNVVAMTYIYGVGMGAELVFPSNSTEQPLGGGYSGLNGVAVDGIGNAYVVDPPANAVKEVPAGCTSSSCVTTLGGGFSEPSGVALDGGGNIYIADSQNNAVKVMPPSCASSSCVTALGGGFSAPANVAIDGSANVYVADTGNNAVEEMPPGCASSSCVTTLGGGFNAPKGVALDASGNVYVADSGNRAVKEVPVGCASASCVTSMGGGFSEPADLAVDASGTVYVADEGSNALYEIPPGCGSTSCVATFGGSFSKPAGIALDGSGNVYVTDAGNNTLDMFNYSSSPSLSFATTARGATSVDSPKTVTVANIGNESVVPHWISYGTDFPEVSGIATDCSTSSSLAPDGSCTLSVDFSPRDARVAGPTIGLSEEVVMWLWDQWGHQYWVSVATDATETITPFGWTEPVQDAVTGGTTALVPGDGFTVAGVAADTHDGTPVRQVQIVIDGTVAGNATLGLASAALAVQFNNPAFAKGRWTFTGSTSNLSPGIHTLSVIASDSLGQSTTIRAQYFLVATSSAGPPFGWMGLVEDAITGGTSAVEQSDGLTVSGVAADPHDGTPVQQVQILIDGTVAGNATLGLASAPLAAMYNNPAFGKGHWTFACATSNLSLGTHTLSVVVSDSLGLSTNIGTQTFTVATTSAGPPIGWVGPVEDAITGGTTSVEQSDGLTVSGVAADPHDGTPVQQVQILIDGTVAGNATLGLASAPLATLYNNPAFGKGRWTFAYATSNLSLGNHTLSVVVSDSLGLSTTIGTESFMVATTSTGPPFGWVEPVKDAVTGSTASVSQADSLRVGGVAADPHDGTPVKQVQIVIDGTVVGNATLGLSSPGLKVLYNNPAFATGRWTFTYAASNLSLGTHTLSVVVSDSLGLSATIGTETFTVAATGAGSPSGL